MILFSFLDVVASLVELTKYLGYYYNGASEKNLTGKKYEH